MTEVRRLKALLYALLVMPGSLRATGAGACVEMLGHIAKVQHL